MEKYKSACCSSQLKILSLSFAFMLVFIMFTTAQSFITSLHHVGFLALAVLYFFYGVFSPFAPLLGNYLGIRISFMSASLVYVAWVLVSLVENNGLFVTFSAFVGIAAAVLWNQFGVYVMKLTKASGDENSSGYFNGIFFSIFGFSDIAGILISFFVIDSGIKMEILMYILASVGSLGVVLFIFLPNPDDSLLDVKQENKIGIEKDSTIVVIELCTISNSIEKKVANDPITTNVVESGSETSVFAKQISNIWEIMKLDFMIYYSIYGVYFGFVICYSFTKFPLLVDVARIPTIILSYSIAFTVFSIISGYLFDRFGGWCLVLLQITSCSVVHCFYSVKSNPEEYYLLLHIIMAILLGLSDSFVNSNSTMSLNKIFNSRPSNDGEASQVLLRVYFVIGTVSGCLIGYFSSFRVMSIITLIFICVSSFCYYKFNVVFTRSLPLKE